MARAVCNLTTNTSTDQTRTSVWLLETDYHRVTGTVSGSLNDRFVHHGVYPCVRPHKILGPSYAMTPQFFCGALRKSEIQPGPCRPLVGANQAGSQTSFILLSDPSLAHRARFMIVTGRGPHADSGISGCKRAMISLLHRRTGG